MASIRLISSSNIQAATNHESLSKQSKRIDLTASDLRQLLLAPIQKGLLFSKPPSSSESKTLSQNLVQHLKTSLSRTLGFFFPLAGRLATIKQQNDNIISFFIDCNNAGAQFVHAVADNLAISDILEPIYVPPIVHSFFPLNGVKNYEGVSKPLLAVQVTELADGIFIGFTINHVAADGTTFWHFVNSWSEISRGNNSDCISKPPVFELWFRSGSYCSVIFPLSSIKTDDEFTPPRLQKRIFHFSKESIARLKAKANAEAGVETISSLQSLLAHIWRSVTRSRQLDPEEEISIRVTIGARSRLKDPPMPEEYFGNAIDGEVVAMKTRETLENGLGFLALQISKMIRCCTEKSLRNNIECWIKNPKLKTLSSVERNTLLTSSSSRFNVYGNDFGWGRPIAVRSGQGNEFDGMVTIYPGGGEEGSIDVEVSIFPEVLQAMANDSCFMNAVTISS